MVLQYKVEASKHASVDSNTLNILDKQDYDASSFACVKSGKYWADLWAESKKYYQVKTGDISREDYKAYREAVKRHSVFVNRNYSNLLAASIGHQADKTASMGYGGEFGGPSVGGAIALEHHLLEKIGSGTAVMLHNIPGIGEKAGDFYETAKFGTEMATNVASKMADMNYLTGGLISNSRASELTQEELRQESEKLEQVNEESMLGRLADSVAESLNIKEFLEQVNEKQIESERISAQAMEDITKFMEEHRAIILALTAGAGVAMLLKNTNFLRALSGSLKGKAHLSAANARAMLSGASEVLKTSTLLRSPVFAKAAAGVAGVGMFAFSGEAEAASGRRSIWSESEARLSGEGLLTFNGSEVKKEAFKTYRIDMVKDLIVDAIRNNDNAKINKYNLAGINDVDNVTSAQLDAIDWGKVIGDIKLRVSLSREQQQKIVDNNRILREFFKANKGVPITTDTVEAVLRGDYDVGKLRGIASGGGDEVVVPPKPVVVIEPLTIEIKAPKLLAEELNLSKQEASLLAPDPNNLGWTLQYPSPEKWRALDDDALKKTVETHLVKYVYYGDEELRSLTQREKLNKFMSRKWSPIAGQDLVDQEEEDQVDPSDIQKVQQAVKRYAEMSGINIRYYDGSAEDYIKETQREIMTKKTKYNDALTYLNVNQGLHPTQEKAIKNVFPHLADGGPVPKYFLDQVKYLYPSTIESFGKKYETLALFIRFLVNPRDNGALKGFSAKGYNVEGSRDGSGSPVLAYTPASSWNTTYPNAQPTALRFYDHGNKMQIPHKDGPLNTPASPLALGLARSFIVAKDASVPVSEQVKSASSAQQLSPREVNTKELQAMKKRFDAVLEARLNDKDDENFLKNNFLRLIYGEDIGVSYPHDTYLILMDFPLNVLNGYDKDSIPAHTNWDDVQKIRKFLNEKFTENDDKQKSVKKLAIEAVREDFQKGFTNA